MTDNIVAGTLLALSAAWTARHLYQRARAAVRRDDAIERDIDDWQGWAP